MAWPEPHCSLRALSECQNSVLNNRLQSPAVPLRFSNGMGIALSVLLALASTRKSRQHEPAGLRCGAPLIALSAPCGFTPLSGRDRRHYVRELRAAEQAHRDLPAKVEEAYRAARAVACHEWNVRQFIGGPGRAIAQDRRCDCWRLRTARGALPAAQS